MSFPENQRDPTLKSPTHKIPTQRGRYLIYYLLTCLTLEPEKNKNKKMLQIVFILLCSAPGLESFCTSVH